MAKKLALVVLFSSILSGANAGLQRAADKKFVLASLSLLEEAKIKPLFQSTEFELGVAKISTLQQSILSRKSHEQGHCGGFEVLGENFSRKDFGNVISQFAHRRILDQKEMRRSHRAIALRPEVENAVKNVRADEIQSWVKWLSSYRTRYEGSDNPNEHVVALQNKLNEILAKYPKLKAETTLISHEGTSQKTLRLRIPGTTRADEIVALGAHLDSINWGPFMPTNGDAPGADDDASGVGSVLEGLRNILPMAPFERSIELFFYAAEEIGLVGSKEIAGDYKAKNAKVAGVLQLDMTLFPGSGAGNISSMSDYTSPELRALLVEFNRLYLHTNIIDDKCGYGCSDHASWYKNGYPTLMPFEARMQQDNKKIHTADDLINSTSSFDHAAIFSKIAVAFISHLGSP